jgi:ribosome-binding protein aMBF1 (putative translation factor)
LRIPVDLRDFVDKWAQQQDDRLSRSEAIRRLLNIALTSQRTVKGVSRRPKVPNGTKNAKESILEARGVAGFQIRAARAILGWSAEDLARESSVSLRTIRRAELSSAHTSLTVANERAIRRALEAAGVDFIDKNGGGPGVRLRKRQDNKET